MRVNIKKKIGKSVLSFFVDEEDWRESLAGAALFANTPDKCTVCGNEDVLFDSNRTQEGYLYIKIRCLDEKCGAQATLGVHKDGVGGWWKSFEKYDPEAKGAPGNQAETPAPAPAEQPVETKTTKPKKEEDDSDFPF